MATMSSPLTAKRRKLNSASNTLSKPFVSPLKTSKLDPIALKPTGNAATHTPYRPSMLAHTIAAPPTSESTKASISKPSGFTAHKSTPIRKPLNAFNSRSTKDPAEQAAEKAIRSLEFQIRATRNDLDTLSQAARLKTSDRDSELEELASKWKAAAQQAAEEVFGSVKERVCRMGGVQAWRENEKKKFDRVHGMGEFAEKNAGGQEDDDEDCEFDSQGEELPEEEAEWRKSEKRRMKKEAQEAMEEESGELDMPDAEGRKEKVWEESGADDDEFTMDMMLRSLNIDLEVIGYDRQGQRWVL